MLAMRVLPVPPQLRIVLLLEPNLVKKVRHSRVHSHGGKEIRVSRDSVRKDIYRSLSVLNAILGKKISKIFSPA